MTELQKAAKAVIDQHAMASTSVPVYMVLDLSKALEAEQTQQVQQLASTSQWLIRKVPNTKDTYYVAEGTPPDNVLEVYGIKQGVSND